MQVNQKNHELRTIQRKFTIKPLLSALNYSKKLFDKAQDMHNHNEHEGSFFIQTIN